MSIFSASALEISLSEVPEYLVGSDLHRNFYSSDGDVDVDAAADVSPISVPAECMKLDAMDNNLEDLKHLLRTSTVLGEQFAARGADKVLHRKDLRSGSVGGAGRFQFRVGSAATTDKGFT